MHFLFNRSRAGVPDLLHLIFRSAHQQRHHLHDTSIAVSCKWWRDRKSTRLNSSHITISYAVFCLKKKKKKKIKIFIKKKKKTKNYKKQIHTKYKKKRKENKR